MSKVCVLGAGSWGSALASVLDDNGHEVSIWARRTEQVDEINNRHSNEKYLKGVRLSDTLRASSEIHDIVSMADFIVLAVPSQQIRSVCKEISKSIRREQVLVNVAKGIEKSTSSRLSQVCLEELPNNPYCILSGPSHAEEVIMKMPTTLVSASESLEVSQKVQDLFMNEYIRVYTNTDMVGVELGSTTKNIIAFGAGILEGMGLGDNSKAALMTRGIAEISRFGVALGADISTFSGLSGIGDLIVTCTSMHSRNRRAGILVGQGYSIEETQKKIDMVVEGITATEAVYKVAKEIGVEMPITECIYRVVEGYIDPKRAVKELMTRNKKYENESIFKL
nr:NAD(P)H-dependent glycerol-3-phosphate dehydrogenase [uncultured Peptostreptococcus sp.]